MGYDLNSEEESFLDNVFMYIAKLVESVTTVTRFLKDS